jgi:hypothetical protein
MFKHHVHTRLQMGNTHKALWSINMENGSYIIKYIKQPSQLYAKNVYAKTQTHRWQNECTQIDKYENEHDGGSKNKWNID